MRDFGNGMENDLGSVYKNQYILIQPEFIVTRDKYHA